MSIASKQQKVIDSLQENDERIVLDNVFANPKILKTGKKGDITEIHDTLANKLFFKFASCMDPKKTERLKDNESAVIKFKIAEFVKSIHYSEANQTQFIKGLEKLQLTLIKWKEGKIDHQVQFITYLKHDKGLGLMEVHVHGVLAKRIAKINLYGNFSFLQERLMVLEVNSAVRLYPFFKSWQNKGFYKSDVVRFKADFGYSSSGYDRFTNLEKYVIIPAIDEINSKTDIEVKYQKYGKFMDSLKPRITDLSFSISLKSKSKKIEAPLIENQQGRSEVQKLIEKVGIFECDERKLVSWMQVEPAKFKKIIDYLENYIANGKIINNLVAYVDALIEKDFVEPIKSKSIKASKQTYKSQNKISAESNKQEENLKERFNSYLKEINQKSFDSIDKSKKEELIKNLYDSTPSISKFIYFQGDDISKITETGIYTIVNEFNKIDFNYDEAFKSWKAAL